MSEPDQLDETVEHINEITGSFRMPDWDQVADEDWQQMLLCDEQYQEWMTIQEARRE